MTKVTFPRQRVLYVAGPMTGIEGNNYPAFQKAAESLREAGYKVINPAENFTPKPRDGWAEEDSEPAWADWMRISVAQVAAADSLALLPGADQSPGARLEMRLAADLGMRRRAVPYWIDRAARIQRLRHTDQFGHDGMHRGNGSEDCPRRWHHHHDPFCEWPTLDECLEAGVEYREPHLWSSRAGIDHTIPWS